MLIAVTRPVSPTLAQCELTHLVREPIDVTRAVTQHADYERRLCALGASLVRVAPAPELPDAVFIEDTAIVLEEVAVITRPGALARQDEPVAVSAVLASYRPILTMTPPARLDGGDILQLGRTLYAGQSGRTNREGLAQLQRLLAPFDYRVVPIEFAGCLHLKSAVTRVADGLLLLNPVWVAPTCFPALEILPIDPREPYAANALRVSDTVVYPASFPRTCERLLQRRLAVAPIDCSELAKAEGAVTCCSLVFEA